MSRTNALDGGFESRHRVEHGLRRWSALGLLAAACACSSSRDESGPTPTREAGAGGELAEVPASGGAGVAAANPSESDTDGESMAPASVQEAQDPNALGNVVPEPVPGGASVGPPQPSSGCAQPTRVGSGAQGLDVDGVARTYRLDLPAGYDGTTPYPLVFAFHGATTSGELFRSARYGNLLSAMADAAIVVHPDALGDPTAWNTQADLPFFDALLSALGQSLCVDDARVFATGHSSGGFFTNTLGCQRGDVLRAIAPVSAGGPFTFGESGCAGDVAVWLAHAENDETVPFDSGVDSRDRWLTRNDCADATSPAAPSPCVQYAGCGDGLAVRWCVYQDGHNWPDFAPEGIWSFFSGL
jgi:polyhydroxybutyrate depolymerase